MQPGISAELRVERECHMPPLLNGDDSPGYAREDCCFGTGCMCNRSTDEDGVEGSAGNTFYNKVGLE